MMGLFCTAEFNIPEIPENTLIKELPSKIVDFLDDDIPHVLESNIDLLLWISRRYYEIMIFQTLQYASNRLESLSTDDLTETARALLDILIFGSINSGTIKDSFLVSMNITYP